MIQFINVSKLYDNDYLALDDVSFEIEEGEFVFLIGPSGSGKTTIIRHLIREERPTEGRIYFEDDDITSYKRNQVYDLRRKIGVIFQDYKLINDKNAYENIAFAMEAAGQNPKEISETVPYVLDIVGLANKWNAFPEQLSGGEKQRVAIARALSNNPKLLIADEPTGNLDPEAAWDIVQILTKINNWGTTVLMSTHGSDIVDTLGKRVIKLEEGKLLQDILKGTYQSDALEIAKEKSEPKPQTKKPDTKKTKDIDNTKDNENEVEDKDEDKEENENEEKNKDKTEKKPKEDKPKQSKENAKRGKTEKSKSDPKSTKTQNQSADNKKLSKSKSSKKKVELKELPPVSLTDRRKTRASQKQEFENKLNDKFEKSASSKGKNAQINDDSDIKQLDLNPKLTSILKAFGYDTIKSLKDAGYKKIAKIDDLSTKDLKQIKEIIDEKIKKSNS